MNDVYSYTGFNISHLNNKNKYILIFYVRIIVDVKIANLKDNGLCNGIIDFNSFGVYNHAEGRTTVNTISAI